MDAAARDGLGVAPGLLGLLELLHGLADDGDGDQGSDRGRRDGGSELHAADDQATHDFTPVLDRQGRRIDITAQANLNSNIDPT